jgi:hypothetical protein
MVSLRPSGGFDPPDYRLVDPDVPVEPDGEWVDAKTRVPDRLEQDSEAGSTSRNGRRWPRQDAG